MTAPEPAVGPLDGLTVLDLTQMLSGPFCTMILGDLGARVVKVEQPGRGDISRPTARLPGDEDPKGFGAYFASINRNKESIAVDLKQPGGRDVILRLVPQIDILAENFRAGFANFEFDRVAEFGPADVERLLQDAGIVRHRGKIESTINNAQRARALRDEFGSLAAYFWVREPGPETRPRKLDRATLGALGKTPESTAISKDLKKRGWSFVGPTTVYAFMQAMGLVNDHLEGCYAREIVEAERAALKRPG